ncbi:MAG: pectin methylesterase [Lachnospiraceae bacterium]|nr:pectin methylesterase [Lachnospiraceae bacterium]
MSKEIIVGVDSDYATLTEAIASLPQNDEIYTIKIKPGSYYEKIELRRGNLVIEGMGNFPSEVELTYDDCARQDMPDGTKRGTFRSYSFFIDADNVTLRNLTISNTSGPESEAWQAIALYADGDNLTFENIRLIGHQDTLFTGPLPPKEIQPGGFIGPKQYDERINGRQMYKNCYICGNVDFIFGSATAYFDSCTIESVARAFKNKSESKNPSDEVQGYTCAPSTPEGQAYGYIFKNCDFISKDCPSRSVYLGRPWRDYAKSVYIDCSFGDHIMDEGFHDWNKELAREVSYFAVLNCYRPDGKAYCPTADFVKCLTDEDLNHYTVENAFKTR